MAADDNRPEKVLTDEEIEKLTWESTDNKHVMRCAETGKFHFVDEAEFIDGTPHADFDTAVRAMRAYAETL